MNTPFQLLPLGLALVSLQAAAQTQDPVQQLDAITVLGSGRTRQVSELRESDLTSAAPGSSPLKVLAKLPGVNFQSADPLGAYEWSTKLTVRGFSQNQLGFTLDGVPLGDMSYRNHNGLHISRAISTENLQGVELSQGAGALGTPSTSNLGGTIRFRSRDPSAERGGTAAQTLGSDATRRTFVRVDSGTLGEGTRVSLSATDQKADKWKGEGEQRQQQVNAKVVSDIGPHRLSAYINGSSRKEVDYQDLSKAMIARLGDRWDNYSPDWNAALDSANGVWHRGETSVDDAYYAGSGLRRDWLGGVTFDWAPADNVSVATTVYHHNNQGPSLWYTPYVPSSATVPVSLRTVEYGLHRTGALTALSVSSGIHDVEVGLWYEDNAFDQAMRFYDRTDGPGSPYDTPSNPMSTRWDYRFDTRTVQFHARDTLKLSPRLKVDAGFRALSSETEVHTRSGADKHGSIRARDGFLPQAGVNYRFAERQEAFAGVSRNMRTYKGSAMEDSPFASTQEGFDATQGTLKPETSTTLEAGWRFREPGLEASFTVYHVDFRNRLLGIQPGSAIAGNPTVLANVGKVRTQGAEAGVSWVPARNWRWDGSLSFNDSRYRENFVTDGNVVAVAGKQVVDAPRWLATTRVAYEQGGWSAHLGANHVGKRYYTYLNDNGVDAYTLWDLGVGYRQASHGFVKAWSARVSINNLTDKHYVASIGTNGFVASDPSGTAQTLLVGAPRSAYLTVGADF